MSRSPVPSHEEIDNRPVKCQVCGKEKPFAESMPAEMVRDSLARILRKDFPGLKAEFEIRSLHEKIDHMLVHQWQRLMEIQQVQTDLLSELRSPKSGS
jgi:flagellar biosynthesis component FlhA